ncbi:Superfamily II DNA helicase [Legionella hackeliae]|nr:Superfamily II DNA helicase [Legionella hackeliae]
MNQLSTFGIGKDKSANYWKHLAWQLIHRDYCYQDVGNYNVLRLTKKAVAVLKNEEQVSLALPQVDLVSKSTKSKQRETLSTANNPLFEVLRTLRRKLADEENKPPFMIFSDTTFASNGQRQTSKPQ